jgi:hypothetical protein
MSNERTMTILHERAWIVGEDVREFKEIPRRAV